MIESRDILAELKRLYNSGATQQEISDLTGVSRSYVRDLLSGKRAADGLTLKKINQLFPGASLSLGKEKKTQEIDDVALNTLIADAALEVVRIAQDWELEAGMSYENPVLEVASAILRQNRAIKLRHYQDTCAAMLAAAPADAPAPVDKPGRFALPPALRKLFHDDLKGADDEC